MVIIGDSHVRAFGFDQSYFPIFLGPGKENNFISYENASAVLEKLLSLRTILENREVILLFGEPDTRFALGKGWHSWNFSEQPDDVGNNYFIERCVERYVFVLRELKKSVQADFFVLAPLLTSNPNQTNYLLNYGEILRAESPFNVVDINESLCEFGVLKREYQQDMVHANFHILKYLPSHRELSENEIEKLKGKLLIHNKKFGCYEFKNKTRFFNTSLKLFDKR